MKKYLISSFSLVMILSTTLSINANSKIKDIEDHWAKKEIFHFIKNSYVKGYEDNTFKPDKQITRAEFIKIINNYFGFDQKGISKFSDINPNEWYYNDVCIAIKAGYINGYDDNTFKPNRAITREEATKIIVSIQNQIDNTYDKLNTFQDKHLVSNWAKPYIEGAIENGYLKGDDLKRINPKKNITRAESVSILSRIDKNMINKQLGIDAPPKSIEFNKNQKNNRHPDVNNQVFPNPSFEKVNKKPIIYVAKDSYSIPKSANWDNYHPELMINASAYDKDGKELDVEYVGFVDTNSPAIYTVTVIARDSFGNYAEKKVYVTVENYYSYYIDPTLNFPSNTINLNIGDSFSYDMLQVTATDYRGYDISSSIRYSGKVNTKKTGWYPVILGITDENGNSTSETIFVKVR